MPELPEVQTTVDYLQKKLVGLRFKDVWTDPEKPTNLGHGTGWSQIKRAIKGQKILNVRRRAKFIIIDVEGAYSIFIHQKISGHLLYGHWMPEIPNSKNQIPNKFQIPKNLETIKKWTAVGRGPLKSERENQYIRTIWFLSNGYQLAFSDLRRFGKIILVKDEEIEKIKEIKKLGPEPLEISFREFRNLFDQPSPRFQRAKKRGRIKQVLMDPCFIAGIGNIYSDEILWDAGFHPLSRAEKLNETDLKKIYNSTVKILKKAIKLSGSSVEDYRMPSGEKGEYQNQTKAYQHEGEKCSKNDGGIIQRIKTGGRSAHFCPIHQRKL